MDKVLITYFIVVGLCAVMFIFGVARIVGEIETVGLKNIIENVWEGTSK